tara:strand:+ start:491 stop:1237 length:747 start_codon:yes stop_codon:yes gene_type:complete
MNKHKTIWMFWTGDNEMSDNRKRAYDAFCQKNDDCSVRLVCKDEVESLENIHEGYEYLSPIQKGDYLKAYYMHHFGGGYADVKDTSVSWLPFLQRIIDNEESLAIGYAEASVHGVARLENCRLDPNKSVFCRDFTLDEQGNWSSFQIRENWRKLIGNGGFVFRPNTALTLDWWNGLTEKMDGYLPELKEHPAQWARDAHGCVIPETGEKSKYPITWAVICGNILHPLALKYHEQIDQDLPHPDCTQYQ